MKNVNNSVVRIISALLLGLILILWPSGALEYLVRAIGLLFLVAGLVSIVGFLIRDKELFSEARFPIDAAGSALFGLVLVIIPSLLVNVLMYVLGILLALACIQHIVLLTSFRRLGSVSFVFYFVPALVLLFSILILFHPFAVAKTTLILLGVSAMLFGISELVSTIRFRKRKLDNNT